MEKRPEIEEVLGGESACYAHLLCEECGAVLDDSHRPGCPQGDNRDNEPVNDDEELDSPRS